MLCWPRREALRRSLAMEVGDATEMERNMMHTACNMLVQQMNGDRIAGHGRLASRAGGWLGAPFGVRVTAALIGGVYGSSVPDGRRIRYGCSSIILKQPPWAEQF